MEIVPLGSAEHHGPEGAPEPLGAPLTAWIDRPLSGRRGRLFPMLPSRGATARSDDEAGSSA